MQYILLAAGKGHRLNMDISNKCFAQINGKSLLDYNLELANPELFSEIIMVVGYHADYIKQYVGDNYHGIKVTYVHQEPLLGIAHAIKQATPSIKEDFMMGLSDELHSRPRIQEMADYLAYSKADCVCGVVLDQVQNIRKAYTVKLNEQENMTELIEKPTQCFNNFKGTGICMMKPSMLKILDTLKPNKFRKEYEMGNWIQAGIDDGLICKIFQISDANFNINEQSDLSEAAFYFEQQHNI